MICNHEKKQERGEVHKTADRMHFRKNECSYASSFLRPKNKINYKTLTVFTSKYFIAIETSTHNGHFETNIPRLYE